MAKRTEDLQRILEEKAGGGEDGIYSDEQSRLSFQKAALDVIADMPFEDQLEEVVALADTGERGPAAEVFIAIIAKLGDATPSKHVCLVFDFVDQHYTDVFDDSFDASDFGPALDLFQKLSLTEQVGVLRGLADTVTEYSDDTLEIFLALIPMLQDEDLVAFGEVFLYMAEKEAELEAEERNDPVSYLKTFVRIMERLART